MEQRLDAAFKLFWKDYAGSGTFNIAGLKGMVRSSFDGGARAMEKIANAYSKYVMTYMEENGPCQHTGNSPVCFGEWLDSEESANALDEEDYAPDEKEPGPEPKPNFNIRRNCAYGVIPAMLVPGLMEEIIERGTNKTYEKVMGDLTDEINNAVGKFSDALSAAYRAAGVPEDYVERIRDDALNGMGSLLEPAAEHIVREEPTHSYTDEYGTEYETMYLGGAMHIVVVDSPFLTYVSPCNQCVPGAGDLANPAEFEYGAPLSGMPCLTFSVRWWDGIPLPKGNRWWHWRDIDGGGTAISVWQSAYSADHERGAVVES